MKDRLGLEFSDLLTMQAKDLHRLGERLRPEVYEVVYNYARDTNKEATSENEKHRVYRGQDLIHVFLNWPDLGPCYVPMAELPPPYPYRKTFSSAQEDVL